MSPMRPSALLGFALLGLALLATPASAQGGTTGLEMSIEGTLEVTPREEQLLLVTLHAVSGADALRPAPGARLKVTASYRADGPVAELDTDRHGRAAIRFTPPDEGSFQIVIDAFHGGHSRRFRVPMNATTVARLHLETLPRRAEPGAAVLAFGHAEDRAGRPLVGREVRVAIPGHEAATVRTDERGAFAAEVRMPGAGTHEVRATMDALENEEGRFHPGASASARVPVAVRAVHEGLRARAVPRAPVVAPGQPIVVDVEVRDGLGRPVRATVRRSGATEDPVRANARGVATFRWPAPTVADIRDVAVDFDVSLPGEAPIRERTTIRVAAVPAAADVAPEGGALVPGVPTRLHVRAVRADGSAYAGALTLSAPRLGSHALTTDAEGLGSVEVTLAEGDAPDACGGATALALGVAFDGVAGEQRCVPVDPDASVRVRAVAEEGAIRVRVHRRDAVGRAPVRVTLLRQEGDGLVPLVARRLAGGTSEVTLDGPHPGSLLVRARALMGPGEAEVRGTLATVGEPRPPAVRVADRGAASAESRTLASLLVPAPIARRLEAHFAAPDPLARARAIPRDIGAAHELVRGEAQPAAPLEEPVKHAILRDPWRQRTLFRSGRLALLFRSFENALASASRTEGLEDLAHRRGARWRFKEGIVRTLDDGGLGPEGARDLGGEPMTVERLRRMDRAFGFDAVARRVTRKRLVELLASWRPWVHDRDLDPAFAPHADPRHWWATFCDENGWVRDGWGRPFELRPVAGGRDADVPVVVPGWAITAAGADGRFGTRDDLADPFARTLPPGLYAESVGEAELVQALRRGVLDRETVRLLETGDAAPRRPMTTIRRELPEPIPTEAAPFLAPSKRFEVRLGATSHDAALPPATEPHRVVALAFGGAAGVGIASASVPATAGARLAAHFPVRLHRSGTLAVPLVVVGASRAEGLTLAVEAEGAELTLSEAAIGDLDEGAVAERILRLTPRGEADVARIRVRLLKDGEPVAERRFESRVVDGTPQRTLWAGMAVDGDWHARFPIPDEARGPLTRLVLTAPGRVDADPHLAYGAIARAWARLMAGAGDEVHLADLPDPQGPLEAAQLALLHTALGERGHRRHHRAESVLRRSARAPEPAEAARLLAVLSSVALPRWTESPPERGPAATAHQLREQLWAVHTIEPVALARIAAALLLTDPEDPQGRAAYVRARRELLASGAGRVVPDDDPRERLAGSAALALAAHALGDRRTRDALLRGLGRRTHLASDSTSDGAFWLLAAAAHGTFGRGPGEATLRVDGAERPVRFEDGVAVVAIPAERTVDLTLETHGGAHLARIETRYGRPVAEREEANLRVALEGISGRAGRRSGYEVRIAAPIASEEPMVAITLPAGAHLEPSALAAMRDSDGVAEVAEPDARGVIRVRLAPLAAEQERRFPLPLRWMGAGAREGLALAVWDASSPWRVGSVPARTIEVR